MEVLIRRAMGNECKAFGKVRIVDILTFGSDIENLLEKNIVSIQIRGGQG